MITDGLFDTFQAGDNTGNITLGNGFMIRWGQLSITIPSGGGTATASATYGHAFAYAPGLTATWVGGSGGAQNGGLVINSSTATGFSLMAYYPSAATITVNWIAVGKRSGY